MARKKKYLQNEGKLRKAIARIEKKTVRPPRMGDAVKQLKLAKKLYGKNKIREATQHLVAGFFYLSVLTCPTNESVSFDAGDFGKESLGAGPFCHPTTRLKWHQVLSE